MHPPFAHQQAAIREVKEEAGVDVRLTGVLTIEYSAHGSGARMRVIFLGEPVSEPCVPKTLPDFESAGAVWATLEEIDAIPLRGREPQVWCRHVATGGHVSPMSLFGREEAYE